MASLVRVSAAVAVLAVAACGGGDDGPVDLEATVADTEGGLVDVEDVTCTREDDQLRASGIVRNRGDNPHHVSIAVRFVDGDGVRVELTSDSVSDLTTGESARWDVNLFAEGAGTVVTCEVAATAS